MKNSCPLWMYNFTYNCESYGCTKSSSIENDEAYWTSSAYSNNSTFAWRILSSGGINLAASYYKKSVRPVIVINKKLDPNL